MDIGQQRIDLACALPGGPARPERGGVQPLQLAVPTGGRPRRPVPGQSVGPALVGDHASSLVMADGDGNIIEGKHPVEPTAFFIHARIHRRHRRRSCCTPTCPTPRR